MATSTQYFNFNIAEGTDVVNPLTDTFPNFSTIDSILMNTNSRLLTTANCTKAGTTFSVTRIRLSNGVGYPGAFRFAAPADWNAGDGISLEGGAPITNVILPSGEAAPTGCFVTGAAVIAVLVGSTITLMCSGKYIPTASEVTSTDGNVQSDIDNLKSDVSSIKRLAFIDVTDITDSNGRITIGSTYFDNPVYNILSAVPIDSHNNIVVEIGKRYAALDSTVAYLFCKYGIDGAAVPNTEITIRIWYVDAQ